MSATTHATGHLFDAETDGLPTYEATGGDWSDIAEEAARLGEQRIVVNMGPQHPSTHGVLRLMLEIDGETVTEARAGIGYLHTGIEKNMEFRTWTQGVTFCTRMDYLAPLFQEAAYCLAVEKLLGITDDVPERATQIRVLMMELNRIASHLVRARHRRQRAGRHHHHDHRLHRPRGDPADLRAHHRPAHEPRLHPPRRRRPGHPPRVPSTRSARRITGVKRYLRQLEDLMLGQPILKGRLQDVGVLNLASCMALGITGPMLRSTGLPYDVRKAAPYCGYETYDFDIPVSDNADCWDRMVLRIEECYQSMKIVDQVLERLKASTGSPVMVEDKKIAWPAQLALGSDGMGNSRGPHPGDHGHLDGRPDPPTSSWSPRASGSRPVRSGRRSSTRAASSACT
ncbi:NADH-quinone oxidoreductase subunit D [Agrobacterium sp. S2]|nr:NADH-quinone oxidoreductase subunit D [Agrobacterium sp. S2]